MRNTNCKVVFLSSPYKGNFRSLFKNDHMLLLYQHRTEDILGWEKHWGKTLSFAVFLRMNAHRCRHKHLWTKARIPAHRCKFFSSVYSRTLRYTHTHTCSGGVECEAEEAQCEHLSVSPFPIAELQRGTQSAGREEKEKTPAAASYGMSSSTDVWCSQGGRRHWSVQCGLTLLEIRVPKGFPPKKGWVSGLFVQLRVPLRILLLKEGILQGMLKFFRNSITIIYHNVP